MKIGRPPKPAAERRSIILHTPVNAVERATLDAWAKRADKPLAELVRETCLRAAKR